VRRQRGASALSRADASRCTSVTRPALEPGLRHVSMATSHRFRILNIVDHVTRERLRAVLDPSISDKRVVRELSALIA
jgi:hypothetical protein